MYMHNARRVFCLLWIKKDTFARIYTWRAIEDAFEGLPKSSWPEAWGKMPKWPPALCAALGVPSEILFVCVHNWIFAVGYIGTALQKVVTSRSKSTLA
jgi:hypothetical protein